MDLMSNRIRPYAWGSRTAIAELLGSPSPSPHPQAELWMGAHPGDPSLLQTSGVSLVDAIAADPDAVLGSGVRSTFGARLPFLFKVLAAAEPLSLQAHPSAVQAKEGFAREESSGVPLTSALRNYRDDQHKPELICALTEFHALCGFRDPAVTHRVLAELAVPQLDHYLPGLDTENDPAGNGVRMLFSSLLAMPAELLGPLLAQVLESAVDRVRAGSEFSVEYRTTLELGERYPGDSGVLASLLMNRITLRPGQALFLAAGNLHAYLSGVGVELMANSDNVLRGGLTPKHVDVAELMRVLDFHAGAPHVLCGEPGPQPGEDVYATPQPEFRLSRLTLDGHPGGLVLDHEGPQVVLVTQGRAEVTDDAGQHCDVDRGRSVFVAASDRGVRITGSGVAYRATDGLS